VGRALQVHTQRARPGVQVGLNCQAVAVVVDHQLQFHEHTRILYPVHTHRDLPGGTGSAVFDDPHCGGVTHREYSAVHRVAVDHDGFVLSALHRVGQRGLGGEDVHAVLGAEPSEGAARLAH